ncbi:MAG: hypothetical protein OXN17_22440 [Candidatus Poribacteria bacterium]|nr:hypothetical protein [Candidatus Poribacteria bacterium]MDE0503639.1 hypothetical protein [Candidatus Poribacteria bacterium]
MSHFDHKPFYRRNLPHIQPPGVTFFVTFNLAGSLPRNVLQQWKAEKRQLEAEESNVQEVQATSDVQASGDKTSDQKQEHRQWNRRWFRQFETALDNAQTGPLWLKDERIAKEVAESLHYRDEKVYRLDAYCIMANHVHVVFAPLAILPSEEPQTNSLLYNTLASIMQSLKGYTAWKANRLLGRSGAFWHHESYDHSVRNTSEWKRIVAYVLNNPVKAGLVKDWEAWQWSYCRDYRTVN